MNGESEECSVMSPAYDLILERNGQLIAYTVEVVDALEAWRLARDRFPDRIRAVVCRDPQQVQGEHHS